MARRMSVHAAGPQLPYDLEPVLVETLLFCSFDVQSKFIGFQMTEARYL